MHMGIEPMWKGSDFMRNKGETRGQRGNLTSWEEIHKFWRNNNLLEILASPTPPHPSHPPKKEKNNTPPKLKFQVLPLLETQDS